MINWDNIIGKDHMKKRKKSSAEEKYNLLKIEYDKMKEEFLDKSKIAFKDIFSEFFNNNPEVENFSFKEYTVYFNDGDTCYFSVYSDAESIDINGINEYDDEDESEETFVTCIECGNEESSDVKFCPSCGTEFPKVEKTESLDYDKAREEVSSLLSIFDEDMMQEIFGDHVEVTINRDGSVDINEYTNHD